MNLKKIVFVMVYVCLFNVFSFSVVMANPLLKADKAQLEEWGIKDHHIALGNNTSSDYHMYDTITFRVKKISNIKITIEDILNPAFKIHYKKEFGYPVTPEDLAMAEKKWSENPLLEADDALLRKWLDGSGCQQAYTVPGNEKFKEHGFMDICMERAVPRIMLDTGVKVPVEGFTDPKAVEKARQALPE